MDLYNMNLWQVLMSGGPLMWPIYLCSIFAVAIILEKIFHIYKITIDTQKFLSNILEKMKHHQVKEALQICDNAKSPIKLPTRTTAEE